MIVRLIPHRQVKPRFFVYDALLMGKCIKSVLTVVRAHAGGAYAAKSHIGGRKVDNHVVDTAAAKLHHGYKSLYGFFI